MLRLAFLIAALFVLPALAAEDLGAAGDWHAFRDTENNELVCYMMARAMTSAKKAMPVKKTISKKGKAATALPRAASITIAFRPSENLFPVFSYTAGTGLKDGAEAIVTAGAQTFSLFNAQDSAWARRTAADQALTQAVRKEKRLEIRAKTAKGKILNDKFSLKGSESAYRKIVKGCGIP
jgi:invasion protein IalB